MAKDESLEKSLRYNSTPAERVLWSKLRNKQIENAKFRRQQRIGDYIVDFVCFERNIIIEVDGGQHNLDYNKEEDQKRTIWLEKQGFKVYRFWNNEIIDNLEGVVFKISEIVGSGSPSP